MFTSRFLLFTLACLVTLASALPTQKAVTHTRIIRVRRSTCPKKTTYIYPSSTEVGVSIPAILPTSAIAPTTSVAASTSRPVATSSPAAPAPSAPTSTRVSSTSASVPTSSQAPSPPSSTPTGVIGGLLGNLFPVQSYGNRAWSTSNALGNALALSDSTFRPGSVLRSTPHSYRDAPDGKRALRAFYPRGSYTFGRSIDGGFSFYAPGPANVDLTTAKEATFGYAVYFPRGFGFQLGGKLPGLYGGNSAGQAVGCSGGRRDSACFSARMMWRENGEGEFYTYLPPATDPRFAANNNLCRAPNSHCNPTYGASVGRGSFRFATGAWTYITERVRLNDVGRANGELELFVNGKSVINVGGLILRDSGAGRIRGMQMQTFFGGSKPEFASPKDQEVFFSDFSVAITQTL